MREPTGHEDRKDRRNLYTAGIILALLLGVAVVAGPLLMSKFFPGDGTGSPGNPTHTQPVQPKTK